MTRLSLSFLGPWQVTLDGGTITSFKYDKVRALLAYLAVEADRPHRREALMALLWPELPEAAARNNLRQTLLNLRQAIGDRPVAGRPAEPPFLLTSRASLQFNPECDTWLDVAAFTELLAAGEHHAHLNPESCKVCARQRQQAVELYRDNFLADFSLPDSVAFEEWALLKREWLRRQVLTALARLTTYHERLGQYEQARHYARRQLELEPWREEGHRQLMRLLVLSGERTAALAQYEQCRHVLAEELGVEPETETTALYEQIRDASEDTPITPQRLALPAQRPHTLPPLLTPFVGREAELAEIGRLLNQTDYRLLTLTGPGGVGKTRLALQAAADQLDAFAHGVFYVPLASLPSAGLLATTVASALGLELGQAAQPKAELLTQLRDRELLLVLDNFEHLLLDTHLPGGAGLLADIVRSAPEVTLLVTSRERLNLQGEWVFTVQGLPLPKVSPAVPLSREEVEAYPALALFVQSARRVYHDFTLSPPDHDHVVRICRLVAGLPLAIELAAAWVRVLSCREIAEEINQGIGFLTTTLRDVPERHRTLTAVFDHSWRLLSPSEQAVLRRLSVFQGGFRRRAAEAVAGATIALLANLVDKSLLRHTIDGRYEMHEMIRQYAYDKVGAAAETEATRRRHAAYYLDLAETAEPYLTGAEQEVWLARLEEEHDNVRAILQWTLDGDDLETAARLAGSIWRFWHTYGYVNEGREWLARALTTGADDRQRLSATVRAKALQGAGVLAWTQSDYEQAIGLFETSLSLFRQSGDKNGVAALTNNLGVIAMHQGDYERARAQLQTSLELRREMDDKWGVTVCLNNLGAVAGRQGDNESAQRYYEEALVLSRQLGNRSVVATLLTNLGDVADVGGDQAQAEVLYQESLAVRRELGEKIGIAYSLMRVGRIALAQANHAQASSRYAESLELLCELGDKEHIVYCLEEIACVASTEAPVEQAGRLWGAAEALRLALGVPLPPSKHAEYEPYLTAARDRADPATWKAALDEGRCLSLAQAIDQARAAAGGRN